MTCVTRRSPLQIISIGQSDYGLIYESYTQGKTLPPFFRYNFRRIRTVRDRHTYNHYGNHEKSGTLPKWPSFLFAISETTQMCLLKHTFMSRFEKSDYQRRGSVTTMLESLNWVSLASRRAEAKLIMFYRITNNLVDVTTSALTAAPTRTRGNTHRYLQSFTRIEAYKHSFFPSTMEQMHTTIS